MEILLTIACIWLLIVVLSLVLVVVRLKVKLASSILDKRVCPDPCEDCAGDGECECGSNECEGNECDDCNCYNKEVNFYNSDEDSLVQPQEPYTFVNLTKFHGLMSIERNGKTSEIWYRKSDGEAESFYFNISTDQHNDLIYAFKLHGKYPDSVDYESVTLGLDCPWNNLYSKAVEFQGAEEKEEE